MEKEKAPRTTGREKNSEATGFNEKPLIPERVFEIELVVLELQSIAEDLNNTIFMYCQKLGCDDKEFEEQVFAELEKGKTVKDTGLSKRFWSEAKRYISLCRRWASRVRLETLPFAKIE